MKGTVNGVETVYVGNYYEKQGTTTRKYYFAGAQRVAMRENNTPLYFFLADHLGSTAITVNSSGGIFSKLRYSAWGETREELPTGHHAHQRALHYRPPVPVAVQIPELASPLIGAVVPTTT